MTQPRLYNIYVRHIAKENKMDFIILDIIITFVAHMIIPFLLLYIDGKTSKKQATKIALINSSVCLVLFCILRACMSDGKDILGNGFAPATLYFFIVRAMLTDKNIKDSDKVRYEDVYYDDEELGDEQNDVDVDAETSKAISDEQVTNDDGKSTT